MTDWKTEIKHKRLWDGKAQNTLSTVIDWEKQWDSVRDIEMRETQTWKREKEGEIDRKGKTKRQKLREKRQMDK